VRVTHHTSKGSTWWGQPVAVGARSMATARKHEQHSAATVRATLHPHHASTVQHVKQNARTASALNCPFHPQWVLTPLTPVVHTMGVQRHTPLALAETGPHTGAHDMPPYSSRNPRPMKQQTRAWAPQQAPAPIERPSYTPSAYQQAIIDWLLTGTGNALVDAKAGSGKTSTLCMLSDVIPNDARTRAAFLAFNRPIADELKRRLPSHVQAATWHSVCRSALLRMPEFARFANVRTWVNGSKFHVLFDMIVNTYMDGEKFRSGVRQLVGLMKANALLPDASESDIMNLVERFEIDFDEASADGGIEQGITMAREVLTLNNSMLDMIDFDDMLYFAYIMNAPLMKYTHVFIDEAQDTNLIQRRLLARLLGTTSRLIAVGDPSQAIYGFRGADSEAMNNIAEEFNCARFPLSISYRCPRKVIELAQRIVPTIEARDNAPDGTVKKLDTFTLTDFTSKGLGGVPQHCTAHLARLPFPTCTQASAHHGPRDW
jgi:hypothetical protein